MPRTTQTSLATTILILFVFLSYATQTKALSFDLAILHSLSNTGDDVTAFSPGWVLTNTSVESFTIGTDAVPFAVFAPESIPILNPEFNPNWESMNGITLAPSESVGQLHGNDFISPALVTPTFELSSSPVFNWSGDWVAGNGEGTMTFGLTDYEGDTGALVAVPIVFRVEPFSTDGCVSGICSTAIFSSDPIPEPSTALLVGLGLVGMGMRRGR